MIIWNSIFERLQPWQASLIAGIYSSATSVFDLFWSISKLHREEHFLVFYIVFFICIESIIFLLISFLLFIGIAKKLKVLLAPWLVTAIVDICLSLIHDFVELSSPNRYYAAPCILAIAGLIITLINCGLMALAFMAVYSHYNKMNEVESKLTKIKIHPANENAEEVKDKQALT